MDHPSLYLIFALGVIGAAAPEILRLYNLRNTPQDISWSAGYVLLSIPFLLLGGIVAIALPAINLWSALYAGISTPVVVNTAIKEAHRKTARHGQSNAPASNKAVVMGAGATRSSFQNFVESL